jgi:hypothetical protein
MFRSLEEVNKKAKLFSSREMLFNIEVTDYSKIQQMTK